ncbi:MAG: glycoside hydrolase family 3 protein [Oscillospiraceae bacterium]|nr:glycoside hydrolase family 3 protein [Oscillospiraceae bacterium]
MKVVRTILTAIACFLIAVGIFSVVGYHLYFRYSKPVIPEQATVQEEEAPQEQVQAPEPEPQPESQPETVDDGRAAELLEGMTLEQKIYQLFFVTPESLTGVETATRAGDATKEALLDNPVGGLIYAEKNLEDEAQIKALLSGTQDFLTGGGKQPAFLAIDEEGGDVAPVATVLETTAFDTMAEIGASEDLDGAKAMGAAIGKELSNLGFNVNFAPIADVTDENGNQVIGTRSFGTDASLVASLVSAVINGTQSNGVLNAVAHFPGLGGINGVAHVDRTRINSSIDDLEAKELLPFRAAAQSDAGFIIVSHAVLTALDDQRPCSMSPAVMELLRETIGYKGIILTDTMDIPAITDHYSAGDAALNAITAGADMILCPEDLDDAVEALLKAVENGKLTQERIDESVTRILNAKLRLGLIE